MKRRLRTILILVAVMWFLEALDQLFGLGLDRFGIAPRQLSGLFGVVAAPLMHAGFGHLIANTIPLIVLGGLVLAAGVTTFIEVTITVWLLGGLGTWLIGRPNTLHVGASGIVFGYLGYLLFQGVHRRSVRAIVISIGVAMAYGGLVIGVFPGQRWVSWESHLMGFVAGGIASWLMTRFGDDGDDGSDGSD